MDQANLGIWGHWPPACCSLAGVYDMKGEEQLSGSVTSVKFTNPHGSRAQRDREDRTECGPYRGRDQSDAFPVRDSSPLGFLKTVSILGGRVIQISAGNPNN
jgi:hypothetical protein